MKKRGFIISLTERMVLEEKASEKQVNEIASQLSDSTVYEFTPEAKEAQSILESSTTFLTLDERKKLEEQASETQLNEFASQFSDSTVSEFTPEAKKAQSILESSTTFLTLDERKKLEEQAKETRVDEFASQFSDSTVIDFTPEANEAQRLLDTSITSLTLDEQRRSDEVSSLDKSIVVLTLQEREDLEAKSKETQISKSPFDNITTTEYTQEAQEAQEILNNSTLMLGLENILRLNNEAQEMQPNKMAELFGIKEMEYTEAAKRARVVLEHASRELKLGAERENEIISHENLSNQDIDI